MKKVLGPFTWELLIPANGFINGNVKQVHSNLIHQNVYTMSLLSYTHFPSHIIPLPLLPPKTLARSKRLSSTVLELSFQFYNYKLVTIRRFRKRTAITSSSRNGNTTYIKLDVRYQLYTVTITRHFRLKSGNLNKGVYWTLIDRAFTVLFNTESGNFSRPGIPELWKFFKISFGNFKTKSLHKYKKILNNSSSQIRVSTVSK